MRIEFDPDDKLPLNKPLKFSTMTIIARFVFEEDGEFYPQIYLDERLYELQKCCNMIELLLQKELAMIKQMHQKNVCFVTIGILKMLDINFNHVFVMAVMMYE